MRLHWRLILRVYFSKLRIKIRVIRRGVIVEETSEEGVIRGSMVIEIADMTMVGDRQEGERCLLRKR